MQRLASRSFTSSRLFQPASSLGRGGNRRPLLTSSTAKRYEVFCILPDGRVDTLRVSKAELLAECNIYMRDLLQLGLDVPFALRHVQRMPPFVEARGDCVLLLLGPFKAIVLREKAYVFNLERSSVRTAVHRLKDELATRHATMTRSAELPQPPPQQQQQQREGTSTTPAFELVVMEHLLDELCGAYQRRMRLFHPVVARLLLGLTHGSESDAMEGLHRLVPITNGISNFAMVIDESVECLEFLLKDDDHLRGLLLSAKHQGQLQDTTTPPGSPSDTTESNVSVTSTRAADSTEEASALPDDLRAGCRVALHGLVSQPERNGATGTVVSSGSSSSSSRSTDDHRFEVLLDGLPRVKVAIKASNLRLLFDTASTLDGSATARAAQATDAAEQHALVATAAAAAAAKETLEAAQQEDVELMIEAHHRRLSLIRTQVSQLMRSVKTTQEVTSIRIDVSRNRIIRTNLHLTIASVSIGVMTAMAGFLGMNLELPIWVDGGFTSGSAGGGGDGNSSGSGPGSGPFLTAVAVSAGLGGAVYGFGLAHASGALRRLTAVPSDVEDVVALGRIFEDMSSIEHAVHAHMGGANQGGDGGHGEVQVGKDGRLLVKNEENGEVTRGLNKDEFRALLADDTKRDVSSRELELIYEVFDVSGDGFLRNEEVAKVQAQHAFRRHLQK